jgi:hypothetical protein
VFRVDCRQAGNNALYSFKEFRNSLFPSPLPSHGDTNLKDDVNG